MKCKKCKTEMDFLPLNNAWRCPNCGRIYKVNKSKTDKKDDGVTPHLIIIQNELLKKKKEYPKIRELKRFFETLWDEQTRYENQDDTILVYGVLSRGQCYVTTLALRRLFGGEILVDYEHKHYWNRINGIEVDLTSDQFKGGNGIEPIFEGVLISDKRLNWTNKRFLRLWDKIEKLLSTLVCPICGRKRSTYCKPFTERSLKAHIRNSHFPKTYGWNKRGGI